MNGGTRNKRVRDRRMTRRGTEKPRRVDTMTGGTRNGRFRDRVIDSRRPKSGRWTETEDGSRDWIWMQRDGRDRIILRNPRTDRTDWTESGNPDGQIDQEAEENSRRTDPEEGTDKARV